MTALINYLNSVDPLSSECVSFLKEVVILENHTKGDLLLDIGQISKKVYFVNNGLIRGFYYKKGVDITTGFLGETKFVISPVSFLLQIKSYECLECLSDCELISLSFEDLQCIYKKFPEFNIVSRKIIEKYYTQSELRSHNLRMMTMSERYDWFLKDYYMLINRLQIQHIASFLGMTQETLSRIRKKK